MKKIGLLLFSLVMGGALLQSCEDLDDTSVPVNDFIWKGLNLYYLYQQEVPDLADTRFETQQDLNNYLKNFSSHEDLFESLLYRNDAAGNAIDRWSVIFSDYRDLENALQGVSTSNGMEFGLVYESGSTTNVFGYVRYVLPGTDAEAKGVVRGDIFDAVNGQQLTISNYSSLLSEQTYTINLANYNGGTPTGTGESIELSKSQYAENPVYLANTYTSGSHTIGYLMYNGFYSPYDGQLNSAFGNFASAGVTDLVVDLRYNGGGSVRTATYLASMITGQFTGQVFAKEQWNSKLQAHLQSQSAEALQDKFVNQFANGTSINSLNLNKVYFLVSGSTASASELIINCLRPYVDVEIIGATTVGKNVGSITLYDSPTFSSKDRSNSHRYAMQPIVLRIVNSEDFGDYSAGLDPDTVQHESFGNLGVLGDPAEPLYATAISHILANGRFAPNDAPAFRLFKDSKSMKRFGTEMYKEDLPEGSLSLLKNLQ